MLPACPLTLIPPLCLSVCGRFGLSWESLNKHAYQSVVYMDPMVQNNLPTFISQLRALLSGQDQQLVYADLVRRYLSFDDEMSRAAQQWAAAEARLQEFGQEQATLKAKQRMLREDWELLRAQRKLLQQQVLGQGRRDGRGGGGGSPAAGGRLYGERL